MRRNYHIIIDRPGDMAATEAALEMMKIKGRVEIDNTTPAHVYHIYAKLSKYEKLLLQLISKSGKIARVPHD